MNQRISNIGNIVDSVLNQMKDYGMSGSDRAWLLNIAISFYSDRLRGFNSPALVTQRFPINMKTKIWSFPADYIRYTKVAYQIQGSSIVHVLGLNEDIDISEPLTQCNDDIQVAELSSDGYWLSGWGGIGAAPWTMPIYASGGGFARNYYRVDYERNCLRFAEGIPVGTAYIEYLSAGKGVNEGTLIHLAYRAAMEAWLIKRCCQLKPKVRALARDMYSAFDDDAFRRMWDANSMTYILTVQEGMDEVYKASGFVIR